MNVAIVHSELRNLVARRHQLSPRSRRILRRVALVLLLTLPCLAMAAPPEYPGYSGRRWGSDYGVRSGSCNRAALGAVLAGGAEGRSGSPADRDDRLPAAIALGPVIGAVIGADLGRWVDSTDRACVGHSLELVQVGESVFWVNPNTQVSFRLTPLESRRPLPGCRKFRLMAHGTFGLAEGRTVACPDAQGVWDLAPERQAAR